jgi:hypothetical protein
LETNGEERNWEIQKTHDKNQRSLHDDVDDRVACQMVVTGPELTFKDRSVVDEFKRNIGSSHKAAEEEEKKGPNVGEDSTA